ncbi:MAG: bifunctional demethylmenaquinone methyltransferase/2-methoxy-6-polyprenyl-1,4-benzoquinol methylase [Rhodospirillales bacterium]|nr:bifunctional demethylmenaquinone methyltransferase/2-methoxy-6-polyprenyl-1,4-benzoquinol methylase [Rhodospirillales bacterium]|tara:strand:+ start:3902 stop:4696 length:795 start_codon:yes stop_codon:yes gene_type:complete
MKKKYTTDSASDSETNFGYRRVSRGEHAALVSNVFQSVAHKYDLMNDLMSGGLHRLWKKVLINHINPRSHVQFLDMAAGTGDITLQCLDCLQKEGPKHSKGFKATLCDPNDAMLEIARKRAVDRGYVKGIEFITAPAERIPIEDLSIDICVISFGLRNVTDRSASLSEMHRVLKFGGHFLCLEFSPVITPTLAPLYEAYSKHILPWLGKLITQDRESYQYLVESIRKFPKPDILAEELKRAGFSNINYHTLSGGIVAIHSGWRI